MAVSHREILIPVQLKSVASTDTVSRKPASDIASLLALFDVYHGSADSSISVPRWFGADERAQAIKRRKAIWEALHPGETGGKTLSTCLSDGRAAGPQHEQGFAASTAAAAGMTKQAINQHLARAEALGDDLPRVTGIRTKQRNNSRRRCQHSEAPPPRPNAGFCVVLSGTKRHTLDP